MKKCFKKPGEDKCRPHVCDSSNDKLHCQIGASPSRRECDVREDFATLRCGARADAMLLVRMLTSVAVLVATLVNSCVAEQDPQFKKEELEALLRAERTLKPPLHTP